MKCLVWAICAGLVSGDEGCAKENDPIAMMQSKTRSQLMKNEGESQLDTALAEIADDGLSAQEVASKAAMLLRATQTISVGFDSLPVATKIKLLQASKKLQTSIGAAPELAEIFEGHQQELLQAAAALERSAAESPGLPAILANNSISALETGMVDEAIARKGGSVDGSTQEKGNCIIGCKCVKEPRSFNTTEYIRATWYIQMQQTNGFQQRGDLYCVTATYNETFRGKKLEVAGTQPDKLITAFNNCNKGKTNSGTQCARHSDKDFKPSFGTPLCARSYDRNHPSRLKVAPCALPKGFTGDYWVVAAGPESDNYEWAIVTAGQPSVKLGDGCTTPDFCIGPAQSSCGLWLFTRDPIPSKATMDAMKAEAKSQGISLSKVIDIDHSNCDYDGYFIKPNVRN